MPIYPLSILLRIPGYSLRNNLCPGRGLPEWWQKYEMNE
jgi:hypothetical protein